MELRSPHFDPTAIAFLSIETVDNNVQEVRTVGYCAMNLFISNKTKKAPTSEADTVLYIFFPNQIFESFL